MLIVASVAVAIVAFIIYALERRSKNEPINWEDASKISIVGGLITAGVVFGTTAEVVVETVKDTAAPITQAVQEMFVGTPSF